MNIQQNYKDYESDEYQIGQAGDLKIQKISESANRTKEKDFLSATESK